MLITISMGAGVGGISLLSTVVAIPIAVGLEAGALITGFGSLIGKHIVKKSTTKVEKHQKIKVLASSKLDRIITHVSKALMDNDISDNEFKLIMEELNKYKKMKEEIKVNYNKKLKKEEENSLIKRGKKLGSPFGSLSKTIGEYIPKIKIPKIKIPNFRFRCIECEIIEN